MRWVCPCVAVVLAVVAAAPASAAPGDDADFEASRVTLDVRNVPLADVLRMIAEQTGNPPPYLSTPQRALPVTLSVADVPYWEAMDRLCRQTHLLLEWTMFTEVDEVRDFGAYVGAMKVRFYQFESRRTFRNFPPSNPGFTRGVHDGLEAAFTLAYHLEGRLGVIWSEGTVTELLSADGRKLGIPELSWRYAGMSERPRVFVRRDAVPYGQIYFTPPVDAGGGPAKLGEVRGTVRVECGVGQKQLAFDDLLAAKGRKVTDGALTLTLADVKSGPGRVDVTLDAVTTEPLILHEQTGRYGFLLVDPNGERYRAYLDRARLDSAALTDVEMRAREEEIRRTGRAPATTAGPSNELGETGPSKGQLTFHFSQLPQVEGKWSLVYLYPESRRTHEFAFGIREVPTP